MRPFAPLDVPLDGLNLVEASAGTGKTYNITLLVARLVAERGLPLEEVLVVTFTEAATAQLREALRTRLLRLRAALDPEGVPADGASPDDSDRALAERLAPRRDEARARVRAALRDFDRAAVHTIHGFCRRALVENAFDSGAPLGLELETDGSALRADIARDLRAGLLWDANEYLAAALLGSLLEPRARGKSPIIDELVKFAAEQPDLALVGGEPVDPAGRPDPLPAFETARDLWRSAGREAVAILQAALATGDLKANYYSAAKIASVAGILDGFFSAQRPQPKGSGDLAYFAESRVATGTKKNAVIAGRTPSHPFFDAAGALVAALSELSRFLEAEVRYAWRLVFERARERIEDDKRRRRVQSFADLLLDLDRALGDGRRGPRLVAGLRRRYRAALIDEFQDTDRIQWRIFREIFARGETPLFLIGDPKQSIYAFRGGDVFTYLAAAREAGDRRHTLDVNWRSDPRVLAAVNALLAGAPAPFVDERIGYRPVRPRPLAADRLRIDGAAAPGLQVLFHGRDPEAEPTRAASKDSTVQPLMEAVADDLAGLLSSATLEPDGDGAGPRPLLPSDVAVLVPANRQAEALREVLRRRGIPGVLWNQGSVFESPEAAWFADLLAALADPADTAAIRRLLASDLFGLDAAQLARFEEDGRAWLAWVERFRDWHDLWERRGLVHGLGAAFDCDAAHGLPALARLMTFEGGERRVTNLRHLAELTHAAAVRGRLAMAGVRRWFDGRRAPGAEAGREGDALELESDALAVRLITLHKSKGLEFPVVYLPCSWDDGSPPGANEPFVYHDPDAADRACLDLGSADRDHHLALAAREHFAEKARLLYVGLTRARHHCRVVWAAAGKAGQSALGRLLHPEGHSPLAGRIGEAADDELLDDLRDLERRSKGAIATAVLADRGRRFSAPPATDPAALRPRALSRTVPEARWRSSFSSLVRGGIGPAEGREPAFGRAADGDDPIPLAELPAGREIGTCLHEVLERADLPAADPDAIARVAADRLDAHGFDGARFAGPVGQALAAALDVRLDGTAEGPLLKGLEPGARFAELEFLLPVTASRAVTGREVAEALRAGPGSGLDPGYLERVRGLLRIPPGWLRGFVDLVFEWQGRFWIADYKSNHLGPRFGDYALPALERAMEEHHYHLQAHLYAVAVDRFLRLRVPGYRTGEHFGGVFYLFLRGMRPAPGAAPGVFACRPPEQVIRALDRLFEGGAGAGGEP
jgi:exodeoxyribonuclease V beta subunit